jgi:esterase/lipase superfamily enzyme
MQREYHKWHSNTLNREMELLIFGHGGARVVVIPTQSGRFYDWEDRGMIEALRKHIESGWIQLYCIDSVDPESWDNTAIPPRDRATRHLQYQDYVLNEVVPFTAKNNPEPYIMCMGASFGAYHSVSLALKHPEVFNRVIAMSGIYDIHPWTDGYEDELVLQGDPLRYIHTIPDGQIEALKNVDLIITIGNEDPAFGENKEFSASLWNRGVWHAFRVWDGYAHDWPIWHEMVLHYIGGPDTKAD